MLGKQEGARNRVGEDSQTAEEDERKLMDMLHEATHVETNG